MNIILLSGGSGKRLWPLSNDVRSKQFIKIFKKEDGSYESMVQRVYRQIKTVDTDASVVVATSKSQVSSIHNQLGDDVGICVEPCRRDGCTTVVFSVKDNGIGMSPEFREHVFDSFTREHTVTENGIGGTGLGMAITKNIVDMLGGTIQVESEVGKGTEFTVMLECETSGTTVKGEPAPEQRELLKNEKQKIYAEIQRRYEGKKVLLVEDNELNREIATAIMEEIGLDVDCVEDGTDAVNIMSSAEGRKYDLIFMDIQMPKMDGYQATKQIRQFADKEKAGIPIIAMTANAFQEDVQASLDAGMNAHLSKPLEIELLKQTMRSISRPHKEQYE